MNSGWSGSFVATVSVAAWTPGAVGVKATLNVSEAPDRIVVGMTGSAVVPMLLAPLPVSVTELMARSALPVKATTVLHGGGVALLEEVGGRRGERGGADDHEGEQEAVAHGPGEADAVVVAVFVHRPESTGGT